MQKMKVDQDTAEALNALASRVHSAQVAIGWYTDLTTGQPQQRNIGELLMLIVSEIAEAMEGHRKGLPDAKLPNRSMLEVELADAVIRIADLCGYLSLDLGGAVIEKLAYNSVRPDHKIENRRLPGGKSF
jgi:NTP pyrophosphatase (non-canonical NTP hydrolase)